MAPAGASTSLTSRISGITTYTHTHTNPLGFTELVVVALREVHVPHHYRTTFRTTDLLYRRTLCSERHRSQLRDPMNSGLNRWQLTVDRTDGYRRGKREEGKKTLSKHQIELECGE